MKKPFIFLSRKNDKLKLLLTVSMLVAAISLFFPSDDDLAAFSGEGKYIPTGIYGYLGSLL